MILYVGEDNLIEWDAMTTATDGNYLNSATVTFTLNARDGTELVSSVAMSYVSASDGKYQGILQASSYTLVPGTEYEIRITAAGSGYNGHRRIRARARYHRNRD